MRAFFAAILVFAALSPSPVAQAADSDPAGVEYFESHIRPVLAEQCYSCHSIKAEKLKGKLVLDSREGMLRGGEGGPILALHDPSKSRLITALSFSDPDLQMPPKHQLPPEQIAYFSEWIKMGAPDPRAEAAPPVNAADAAMEKARKFWSFQPVADAAPPAVADAGWPLNDVDRFVAHEQEARHLKPAAMADKRTLIRRATYDLTGLPPTPDELHAFQADASPDAFARVVDRLLASPAYGEQWGRHWLDVVRYADTSGCNSDFPIPDQYRYRNWVIDAFNRDEPYNQFLTEQIAGDLIPAADQAEHDRHIIATGYLANVRRFGSSGEEFHLSIEDAIDNLGKTMLGLSVNCARCHDHKFDPIPTSDYYALYGIFSSTRFAFPGTELFKNPKNFIALGTPEQAKALEAYYAQLDKLDKQLRKLTLEHEVLVAQESAGKTAQPEPTKEGEKPAEARTAAVVDREMGRTKEQMQQLMSHRPSVDKAYAVEDGTPEDTRIQHKGNPAELGDIAPRGFLTVLGGQKLPANFTGSGRLQLAEWITDGKNPLTARVMVNRIWQHHFDVGLVKTPNDFGVRGQPPTNGPLLDYLASRLMANNWSVKSIHRLIMLSRTYQLASDDNADDATIDPPNDFMWRQNARRLSAEEIRDSLLTVGAALDRSPGGAHPFPPESDWHYSQHGPFVADYPTNHRSVYLMQQRIRKQPFLAIFDGADTNADTGRRDLSTTAIQALYMMNDPLMEEQSSKLADRVWPDAGADDRSRIDYAYQLVYQRSATGEEVDAGVQYLHTCAEKLNSAGVPPQQQQHAARASLMHVLLCGDEFLFLD